MKISIITVTKNNKAGLLRAIESLRSQSYKNVEHIIVDGGSTDGSVELIKNLQLTMNNEMSSRTEVRDLKISPYGRNDKDQGDNALTTDNYEPPTISYQLLTISEADSGIYDAINKGIKLATGDVIGLLHSDDFFADENVLENYAEAFTQGAERKEQRAKSREQSAKDKNGTPFDSAQGDTIDAVYSDLVYVRSKTKDEKRKKNNSVYTDNSTLKIEPFVIRNWKAHKVVNSKQRLVNGKSTSQYPPFTTHYSLLTTNHLLNGWMPPHPTLFIRKEIFEKYGLYRTDMKIAADYEMILRLFWKHKITTYYLPITTYMMSIGGASNKSLRNILTKSSEDYKAMKMHALPFPIKTLLMKNLRKLPQFFSRK